MISYRNPSLSWVSELHLFLLLLRLQLLLLRVISGGQMGLGLCSHDRMLDLVLSLHRLLGLIRGLRVWLV